MKLLNSDHKKASDVLLNYNSTIDFKWTKIKQFNGEGQFMLRLNMYRTV